MILNEGFHAANINAAHLANTVDLHLQIRQSKLEEDEERNLRARLRQLEARRSSVERAGLMRQAALGDGGVGGVVEGLRTLQGHVDAILAQEEAYASMSKAGLLKEHFFPCSYLSLAILLALEVRITLCSLLHICVWKDNNQTCEWQVAKADCSALIRQILPVNAYASKLLCASICRLSRCAELDKLPIHH